MAEGKGGVAMYVRLQIAYALEFAIWGCWSYSLGSYGKEHSIAVGALYAAFALGALFAPAYLRRCFGRLLCHCSKGGRGWSFGSRRPLVGFDVHCRFDVYAVDSAFERDRL